jgi:hypothetical protein
MANRYAIKSGNWSDVTVWDGGATLPGASDHVRPNGYTVTIDQNVTVAFLRNDVSAPAAANGSFVLTGSYTITADLYSAVPTVPTLIYSANAPAVSTLVGSVYSAGNSTVYTLQHSGSGTLNITGSTAGGSYGTKHILVSGAGILNVVGNVSGYGTNSIGMSITGNATVIITGGVSGGGTDGNAGSNYAIYCTATNAAITVIGNVTTISQSDRYGIYLTSTSTLNVTGNLVTSGSAASIYLSGAGIVNVTGNITSGSGAAIQCTGAATISHLSGTLYPSGNVPAILNSNYSATLILQGNLSNNGAVMPFYSPVMAITNSPLSWVVRGPTVGSTKTLYTLDALPPNYAPIASNVRSGIAYNNGSTTGTLVVPSPSLVAIGVYTDNTVGSYNPGINAAELRAALGLDAADLSEQLINIKSDTSKIRSKGYSRIERLYP